jgi:putative transposase
VVESAVVERRTQEELRADLRGVCLGAIRLVIEHVLQEEVRELVGARRFERLSQRTDVRTGTYLRRLLTSLGPLEVSVPRTRESGSACATRGRYQRRAAEVDDLIAEAYVSGVSTRTRGAVTDALLGERVGRSTVSRVTQRLADEVEALRTAPIAEPIVSLYLAATFLAARWARAVANVAALSAYGVGADGKRRLLGVTSGPEESEAGLDGVAQAAHCPRAQRRRARDRRRARGVGQGRPPAAARGEAAALRGAPRAQRAHHDAGATAGPAGTPGRGDLPGPEQGRGRHTSGDPRRHARCAGPRGARGSQTGLRGRPPVLRLPGRAPGRLRSTNGLERLHGEIKRRIRAVGAFPDRASALRLVVAVALRVTAIWDDRRYLDMTAGRKEERTTKHAA